VPELEDGRRLAESNAILCYLAEGTPYLPAGRFERAQVLQWMFFEQYSHEPYIAVSRYILTHLPADSPRRGELPRLAPRGVAALQVMDRHLGAAPFFVAERFTVADIALYAYTHVAEEGGFDLGPHPHVRAWLARCADRPGFVAIGD
jgi:glutathione S-transferase